MLAPLDGYPIEHLYNLPRDIHCKFIICETSHVVWIFQLNIYKIHSLQCIFKFYRFGSSSETRDFFYILRELHWF